MHHVRKDRAKEIGEASLIPDFTIVLGVDQKHLEQLRIVWPTWKRHKPSTVLNRRIVVFFDGCDLDTLDDEQALKIELGEMLGTERLIIVEWPLAGVDYGKGETKWDSPQRYKMLAGFMHVAAKYCSTPYFLKIDVDAIATGMDDWIDPEWFVENPAIVGPAFSYTKPPMQMLDLDRWAQRYGLFPETEPLNLIPEPGASLLRHKRIGGWCNFFRTDFTKTVAEHCERTIGPGLMAAPSLDGLLFYAAKRMNLPIRIIHPKRLGWDVRHTMSNIAEAAGKALA